MQLCVAPKEGAVKISTKIRKLRRLSNKYIGFFLRYFFDPKTASIFMVLESWLLVLFQCDEWFKYWPKVLIVVTAVGG